jgi:hypothetical protein
MNGLELVPGFLGHFFFKNISKQNTGNDKK